MIVADVNLVAYLILGGPNARLAEEVLAHDELWAAPVLWRSEFRSILAAHMRQKGLTLADADRAHDLAAALFGDREFLVQGEQVLDLVSRSKCSAYDCEYVALAVDLGVPLVTADRELLKAFPGQAASPREFVDRRR